MISVFSFLFVQIIALIIEGRRTNNSRRNTRARYHKLDNNLEEALGSNRDRSDSFGSRNF